MIDIQESMQKIEEIEDILSKDLNETRYKRFKELCTQVKELHKLTVDVLYAKML
jgi:hypothetical protein